MPICSASAGLASSFRLSVLQAGQGDAGYSIIKVLTGTWAVQIGRGIECSASFAASIQVKAVVGCSNCRASSKAVVGSVYMTFSGT